MLMTLQMVWFRENWYEEILRQLKQGLCKCYSIAFENRGAGESKPRLQQSIIKAALKFKSSLW